MSVTSTPSADGRQVTISVRGRFDFSQHQEFRNSYNQPDAGLNYLLDLSAAEYMDSSALGMLLLFRESAEARACQIRIVHCREEIKKILVIANFQKLFVIE